MNEERSILIVDDEKQLAVNYADMFRQEGWTAEPTFSGKEALAVIQSRPFDAVLLDMRMPEMDGFATLVAILKARPDTCVAFFTAFGDVKSAVRALREGAWTMVIKGHPFEEVYAFVEQAVEQKSSLILAERAKHAAIDREARIDSALNLAQGTAHQIKSRLADCGFTVGSISDANSLHEAQAYVPQIRDSLKLIELSVNNLFRISKVRSMETTVIDAVKAAEQGFSIAMRRHSRHKMPDIEFANNLRDVIHVLSDHECLTEAFENVFDNAMQAMIPKGGEIAINCELDNHFATFEVTDTGPGFTHEMLTRAHEPFCSTRSKTNVGLGLSFVKEVADAGGGSFEYGNRPEGGAWVRIKLTQRARSK